MKITIALWVLLGCACVNAVAYDRDEFLIGVRDREGRVFLEPDRSIGDCSSEDHAALYEVYAKLWKKTDKSGENSGPYTVHNFIYLPNQLLPVQPPKSAVEVQEKRWKSTSTAQPVVPKLYALPTGENSGCWGYVGADQDPVYILQGQELEVFQKAGRPILKSIRSNAKPISNDLYLAFNQQWCASDQVLPLDQLPQEEVFQNGCRLRTMAKESIDLLSELVQIDPVRAVLAADYGEETIGSLAITYAHRFVSAVNGRNEEFAFANVTLKDEPEFWPKSLIVDLSAKTLCLYENGSKRKYFPHFVLDSTLVEGANLTSLWVVTQVFSEGVSRAILQPVVDAKGCSIKTIFETAYVGI